MKTKRIKSFLIAAVIAFESVVMGWVPATAQTVSVSENAIAEQEVAEDVVENIVAETATEAYSGTDGALYWEINSDGHLTISGNGNYTNRANIQTEGWLAHASKIKSATVKVTGITDTSYMFYNCTNLESIDLSGLDTSSVISMQCMFSGCSSLKNLDVSGFGTRNVNDMRHMFYGCRSLAALDVSSFETNSVTDMAGMFFDCSSLTSLDVSGLNTGNVENMDSMFRGCTSLTKLKMTGNSEGFNINIVQTMAGMFYGCSSLVTLDLSGFDTYNATNMSLMFEGCEKLTRIIAHENTSATKAKMELPSGDWIHGKTEEPATEIVEEGLYIKRDIYDGTPIIYSGTDGDLYWEIDENGHLLIMGEGDYKTRTDTSTTGWLAHHGSIVTATVDVKGITKTNSMFQSCENLASVDLEKLDTSAVTDMHNMFDSCYNLARLDVSGFNTAKVENMANMFNGCETLAELDVSSFDTSLVTDMSYIFNGCYSLTTVTAPENRSTKDIEFPVSDRGWRYEPTGETVEKITKAGTYMRVDKYEEEMIVDGGQDGTLYWELNKNGHLLITGEGDYEERLWLEHKDEIISATVNVTGITDTSGMFEGCSGITELDLTGLDTSEVTDMSNMLTGCTNLTTLIAAENKSSEEMLLPSISNYIWKYEPTGETVDKVTVAGTYIRETKPVPAPVTPKEEPKATVETTVKTGSDGSVTTTVKTTEPNGEITLKIVSTSKDEKKETIVDMTISASGQLKDAAVEVANVTKTSKMTINLNELKDLVDQVTLCNTEYVYPVGSKPYVPEKVDSLGDIYRKAQEAIGVAQKKANVAIKVSAKSPSGQKKYSVAIKKTDLTKKKFVVYGSDKKGNAVMVNTKKNKATVNKKKDLTLKVAKKGDYQLQNTKDAKKTNKKIMKTVKPKKSSVTVKKGKSTSFKLSSKCNKDNISKIKYSSDNSKVKVSKKGKISAKGSGTAKVTATVTMKNGQKKKIKVKVKVS